MLFSDANRRKVKVAFLLYRIVRCDRRGLELSTMHSLLYWFRGQLDFNNRRNLIPKLISAVVPSSSLGDGVFLAISMREKKATISKGNQQAFKIRRFISAINSITPLTAITDGLHNRH